MLEPFHSFRHLVIVVLFGVSVTRTMVERVWEAQSSLGGGGFAHSRMAFLIKIPKGDITLSVYESIVTWISLSRSLDHARKAITVQPRLGMTTGTQTSPYNA